MTFKTLLISLHPKFANQVFDGTKKVELRRVKPNLEKGDIVAVYVSSPIQQFWGTFEVSQIIEKPLSELWSIVEKDACLSKDEFEEYYSGINKGYGIYIKENTFVHNPIGLEEVRKRLGKFNPPQSYKYLSVSELEKLTQ